MSMPDLGESRLANVAGVPVLVFDEYQGKPNGRPDRLFEDFCVTANWQGRKFEVGPVGNTRRDLQMDLSSGQQVSNGLDGLAGTSVPHEDVWSGGLEHGLIPPEASHLAAQFLESSVVPAAHTEQDGCSHNAEADQTRSARQDGKEVA
jgi:hypothetical protein